MERIEKAKQEKETQWSSPLSGNWCYRSLLLATMFTSPYTLANTPQFEYQTPANQSFQSPSDLINLRVATQLTANQLQELVFELDDIDITAMVKMASNGTSVSFSPVQPLGFGNHRLTITQYKADGEINEVGSWEFEVRQSALYREASFQAQVDLTLDHRIANRNLDDLPDPTNSQGSAILATAMQGDNWQLDGQMDLIYTSEKEFTERGKSIDMGEFLISHRQGRFHTQVGHHSLGHTSLIMDSFHRRGLSSQIALAELNSSVSGFMLRTDDITGFQKGLGVSQKENRVSGVTWDYAPYSEDPEKLVLSIGWLDGEGNQGGAGVNFDAVNQSGKAWSFSADGQFFDRKLRLRLEHASSEFDFDAGGALSAFDDDAQSILVTFNHTTDDEMAPWDWTLGAESLEVGSFFKSLANTHLPADKNLNRVFTTLSKEQWSFDASYGVEENNLEDDSNFSTTEITQWYVNATYSAADAFDSGFWSWMGLPSLTVSFSENEIVDLVTAQGFDAQDNLTENVMLAAAFSYDSWSWSLGWSENTFEDFTDFQIDSDTESINLDASFLIGESWQLNPSMQWLQTDNLDIDSDSTNFLYGLSTSFVLVPDRLSGAIQYSKNKLDARENFFFTEDGASENLGAVFTINVSEANINSLGFDLSLSYEKQRIIDNLDSFNNLSSYQMFLNFVFTLPYAAPHNE